jgi:hypothetical protein
MSKSLNLDRLSPDDLRRLVVVLISRLDQARMGERDAGRSATRATLQAAAALANERRAVQETIEAVRGERDALRWAAEAEREVRGLRWMLKQERRRK